ncbi:MAG TPA: hypothetical protein GX734_05555 [Clostridiaceae bacterium]|jgi:serine/threonine protein kinase|nr:hypothetical protein [Clostridiaceae bacterium]
MAEKSEMNEGYPAYTYDRRRIAVKSLDEWTDLRMAELLYHVRSPYLPRCLGRTSHERGDGTDHRAVRTRLDLDGHQECERLPLIECHPVPTTPSLVFEWVEGKTMREIDRQALSSTVAEQWFDDILDGLSWLSQRANKPIAHLDISPSNIVITNAGDALLIDFSDSRVLDGYARTPSTSRVFKEGYAAPEIFLGDLLPESDLYSLAMSIISVWRNEPAASMSQHSIRTTLKKFAPSFADRLRCSLSEDPVARRAALRHHMLMPIWVEDQPSRVRRDENEKSTEEGDVCPYSFSTCPFLEVAYILCSE